MDTQTLGIAVILFAAIIFAGIVVFTVSHFYRHESKDERVKRIGLGLGLSVLVIILLSVQLFVSLKQIVYEDRLVIEGRKILSQELLAISPDIYVDSFNVMASGSGERVKIVSDIKTPIDRVITADDKDDIILKLEIHLGLKM
mgnify:CR=1 FL=1